MKEPNYLRPALKILSISQDLTVLLLQPEVPSQCADRNLVGCDRSGAIIWQATPPSRPDCFTGVELEDGSLSAYAFSGYVCKIDVNTGETRSVVFTK